ncbi:GTP-binding protein [Proteobacteria bacterium 005FR1]|nr:GTP-binding protein [Proteobacteria bacterium 005FR1]
MEESIKIVFTGTVGAGKTAAIRTLSDIPVVSTDVDVTDEVKAIKDTTTVAMDYGEVALDEQTTLALYGTPGQERFRYMWEILSAGALGVIIMIDNSRPDPISDLDIYLENFAPFIAESCAVVAVTHSDISDSPSLQDFHRYLGSKQMPCPVFQVDARDREQVLLLIDSMMAILDVA